MVFSILQINNDVIKDTLEEFIRVGKLMIHHCMQTFSMSDAALAADRVFHNTH